MNLVFQNKGGIVKMEKRVLIVDYQHIAHTYMHSSHRLSERVLINGRLEEVDTTIQNGSIKNINRWAKGGFFPTAVCFDNPVPARKCYFAKAFDMAIDTEQEYKAGRTSASALMYESIAMTENLLRKSGVACFRAHNYEADDLVFACVQAAKRDYPGVPIDVITNDADLIPLVDDVVSVFLRSRKYTYAEDKDYERTHYVQITPKNYAEIVEDLSRYSKFYMPYNTVLLHKLLRGDSSDNIPGVKVKFPPRKYNAMIERMIEDGIDIGNVFRYGNCPKKYINRNTREEVAEDFALSHKDICVVGYSNPKELGIILEVMKKYADDEGVLEYIKKIYLGMNLNQAYLGMGSISRTPAMITKPIPSYDVRNLRTACYEDLKIRIE